jgi:hypothetical protein
MSHQNRQKGTQIRLGSRVPPTTVGMMSPTKTWGQSMTHSANDKFLQLGCRRKVTQVGATKLKLMMLFQIEKKNLDFCSWAQFCTGGIFCGCRVYISKIYQHMLSNWAQIGHFVYQTCCGGYIYNTSGGPKETGHCRCRKCWLTIIQVNTEGGLHWALWFAVGLGLGMTLTFTENTGLVQLI